jgi:hypothetical protein
MIECYRQKFRVFFREASSLLKGLGAKMSEDNEKMTRGTLVLLIIFIVVVIICLSAIALAAYGVYMLWQAGTMVH